jgi:hypothetical protein
MRNTSPAFLPFRSIDADADGVKRFDLGLRTDLCLAHADRELLDAGLKLLLRDADLTGGIAERLQVLGRQSEGVGQLPEVPGIFERSRPRADNGSDGKARDEAADRSLDCAETPLKAPLMSPAVFFAVLRARAMPCSNAAVSADSETRRAPINADIGAPSVQFADAQRRAAGLHHLKRGQHFVGRLGFANGLRSGVVGELLELLRASESFGVPRTRDHQVKFPLLAACSAIHDRHERAGRLLPERVRRQPSFNP